MHVLVLSMKLFSVCFDEYIKKFPENWNIRTWRYQSKIYVIELRDIKASLDVHAENSELLVDITFRDNDIRKLWLNLKHLDPKTKRVRLLALPDAQQEYQVHCHTLMHLILDLVSSIRGVIPKAEEVFFHREHGIQPIKPIKMFWWDGKPNFGDTIGPFILSKHFNQPIIQERNHVSSNVIYGVGSIIEMMLNSQHNNVQVWGSGFMGKTLTEVDHIKLKKKISRVVAVRGKLTQSKFEAMGIATPDVMGDPGLLIPEFLDIKPKFIGNIAVIPHHSQISLFKRLQGENISVIDVGDSLQSVAQQIAGASCVLSTSLHGVILAQALQVKWVWLSIKDKPLHIGGEFKFYDFLSTLREPDVVPVILDVMDINVDNLKSIAKKATVYEYISPHLIQTLKNSLNDLEL